MKHEVDDNLSIYLDEHSPWGISITGNDDLSMSPDQKIRSYFDNEEVPCRRLSRSSFYYPNLITVAPL